MNNKNKYLPVWKTSKRLERNYERILNVIQQQFFQAISNQNNPNEMINLLNIIARQYSFEKYCVTDYPDHSVLNLHQAAAARAA